MTQKPEVLDPVSPESERAHRIWRSVQTVKNLSDRVVGIGPFGVGMDGLLTWIPGAGSLYSLAAGAFLVAQGYRAEASNATIAKMIVLLGLDLGISWIPIAGDVVDFFYRAHMMAANVLQRDIEARYGPPAESLTPARGRRRSTG